jgi:uncharacterized membrane protein
MMEAAIAYLHFLSAFLVSACLVTELFICRPGLLPAQLNTLARVDLY